jgi:hypothetical protein
LNTKVARASVRLMEAGRPAIELNTNARAAFEILAPDGEHGVPVVA